MNWVDEHEQDLRNSSIQKSTRIVFENILRLSEPGGSLQLIDESIERAIQLKFHWQVDLAFLAITGNLRDRLSNRQKMYDNVKSYLEETRPDDVESILRGL